MTQRQLQDLCAEYISARQFELAEATRATLERSVRWLCHWMRAVDVSRLDRAAGQKWRNWLVATGRRPSTANMYVRAIKAMLTYARRKKWIAHHPFDGVAEIRVTPRSVTVYEDWQFLRMLHFLPPATTQDPQRDVRWLGLLWGARTTGFRRGELLNLTWDNVRGGMVYVEPKEATDRTWPWTPKTRRTRRVPLLPQFAAVLESRRERYYPLVSSAIAEKLLDGSLSGDWRRCPEYNFRRTFVGIHRRAFGRQIGDFHQLRRTWTTDLADVLPDSALMQLGGWQRRETVGRYAGVRGSHYELAYDHLTQIGRAPIGLQPGRPGGVRSGMRAPQAS